MTLHQVCGFADLCCAAMMARSSYLTLKLGHVGLATSIAATCLGCLAPGVFLVR